MVKTDALDWESYTDPKLRNLEQSSDTAKRLEVERSWAISRPNGKIPSERDDKASSKQTAKLGRQRRGGPRKQTQQLFLAVVDNYWQPVWISNFQPHADRNIIHATVLRPAEIKRITLTKQEIQRFKLGNIDRPYKSHSKEARPAPWKFGPTLSDANGNHWYD